MPLLRIADLETADKTLLDAAMELSSIYDKWDGSDTHERPAGIHASEISGCQRKAVYTMIGTPKKNKPDVIWRKKFKHGHWVHAGIQKDMHELAKSMNGQLRFQDEVPIDPYNSEIARQFGIYGHCDGIFTIRAPDGKGNLTDIVRVGLEIKTASRMEYEKLLEPKKAHIEQVTTYMACLDIPCFWLLYYNKSNENTTGSHGKFFVVFQHGVWNQLAERFNRWHDMIEQSILPDREEGIECDWCPYVWTCKPNSGAHRQKPLPQSTVSARELYIKRE